MVEFISKHILGIGYCLLGVSFAFLCGAVYIGLELLFEQRNKG
jgi:hypothetical protein